VVLTRRVPETRAAAARALMRAAPGLDMYDGDDVGKAFGISRSLACEIAYENDEARSRETPAERWTRMRAWVDKNLLAAPAETR
jgi:hypothetical protein